MSEDLSNPTDTIGGADESVSRAADQDVRPSAICDVLKDAEAQAASMELPASGVAGHVRFLDLFDSNRPPGNLAQAVNALTRRIQRLEKRGHSVALAFDSSTGLFRLVVAEPEKTAKS